jgi:hypothetical protein
MENGWTRYDVSPPLASSNIVQSASLSSSDAVAKPTISLSVGFFDWDYWLSQANHIFSRLGISSNFEDYGTNSVSSCSAIEVHLARQLYWSVFGLTSALPQVVQWSYPMDSCISAHPRISKLGHLHSNGQIVRHIGPWIPRVPIHLAWKMQLTSASPLCGSLQRSGEGHGTPVFTQASASSTRPRVLIRIARMSPGILGIRC